MTATAMRSAVESSLPAGRLARLHQVRRLSAEAGTPTYLAGGPVRDLLLGRSSTDLDFVVVPAATGEATPAQRLAQALARAFGGEVTVHRAFGTATWLDTDGAALDFATARTENYTHPGALPTVAPAGAIEVDLRRRDFSINAMAVRVDGERFGELMDPHGGQADLAAGILRVIHTGSFQDDPTRIFRAVRYEQRLGFRLADDTTSLIAAALPVIAALSGERVRHELELIFREPRGAAALGRLDALGVLAAVRAALRWREAESSAAELIPNLPHPAWQWAAPLDVDSLYLALLLRQAAPDEAAATLERLSVTRAVSDAVTGAVGLKLTGTRPSEIVAQLDALSLRGVVAAYVAQPQARERLDAYLARWRFVRAQTTGDDLLALGLPPGPDFKRLLWRLRAARLDGEIGDEAGEQALARALAGLE